MGFKAFSSIQIKNKLKSLSLDNLQVRFLVKKLEGNKYAEQLFFQAVNMSKVNYRDTTLTLDKEGKVDDISISNPSLKNKVNFIITNWNNSSVNYTPTIKNEFIKLKIH